MNPNDADGRSGTLHRWWSNSLEVLDLRSYGLWPNVRVRVAADDAAYADDLDLHPFQADVADLLQPVAPNPLFRQQLKQALILAHRQRSARQFIFAYSSESSLWPWHVIATVPVLLGIAALIWRHTHRASTQAAEAA